MNPDGALDHIGIVVADLAGSEAVYARLGFSVRYRERIEEQGVEIVGMRAGDSTIELLKPLQDDSPLRRYLGDRQSRLHHLAYRVSDIDNELRRLKAAQVPLLDEAPRRRAHGNRIAFIHPSFSGGTLIELCQPQGSGDSG